MVGGFWDGLGRVKVMEQAPCQTAAASMVQEHTHKPSVMMMGRVIWMHTFGLLWIEVVVESVGVGGG